MEKPKEDKKKKPSKFSGLFKRRDRKSKQQPEEDVEDFLEKRGSQPGSRTSPQPRDPGQEMQAEPPLSPRASQQQPFRQASKLQKAPPRGGSLRRTSSQEEASLRAVGQSSGDRHRDIPATINETADPFDDNAAVADPRTQRSPSASNNNSRGNSRVTSPTSDSLRNAFNPVRDAFRSTSGSQQQAVEPVADGEGKVEKVKKAKARMALDDSDESDGERDAPSATYPAAPTRRAPQPEQTLHPPQPHAQQGSPSGSSLKERLSESPVQVVSPLDNKPTGPLGPLPNLVADSSSRSSQGGISPVSPSESPELVERPDSGGTNATYSAKPLTTARSFESHRPSTPPHTSAATAASAPTTPASHSTAASRSQPSTPWSDAQLRHYMEHSTDDIRDLLVVVGDTSGIAPPGAEHPTVKSFAGERARLAAMDQRLDEMLKGLMARRGLGAKVGSS